MLKSAGTNLPLRKISRFQFRLESGIRCSMSTVYKSVYTSILSLEDGLEEMVDDFSGGKILYGGLRILDPNSNLPKVVFINWVS